MKCRNLDTWCDIISMLESDKHKDIIIFYLKKNAEYIY